VTDILTPFVIVNTTNRSQLNAKLKINAGENKKMGSI
jgi:hypothetical protein